MTKSALFLICLAVQTSRVKTMCTIVYSTLLQRSVLVDFRDFNPHPRVFLLYMTLWYSTCTLSIKHPSVTTAPELANYTLGQKDHYI